MGIRIFFAKQETRTHAEGLKNYLHTIHLPEPEENYLQTVRENNEEGGGGGGGVYSPQVGIGGGTGEGTEREE